MKPSDEADEHRRLRIFVVDDNRLIRNALLQVIDGYEELDAVGQATDTEEAIRRIPALEPDVVILDLHIPGPGGLHVLRQIRALGVKSVVIVFTAYNYPQYRVEAQRLGVDFFFSKTVDNEEMFDELVALAHKMRASD